MAMMEITDRQKLILESVINEHVDTAQPVSSQLLEKKYDFGIKPAMIRIEMERLTDKGFLSQPFVSAGRVPTDKGYRFFVDQIVANTIPEFQGMEKMGRELAGERGDILGFTSKLANFMAESSSSIALLHLLDEDLSLKEGWEELLTEPEFADRDLLFNFADFVGDLEHNIEDFNLESGVEIYIGNENPVNKGKKFTMIISKCVFPGNKKGIVSLIGPKRMPYQKNISLIKSLSELLEDF